MKASHAVPNPPTVFRMQGQIWLGIKKSTKPTTCRDRLSIYVSVLPSARKISRADKQNCHKIWNWEKLTKFVNTFQFWLKSENKK